MGYYNHSLARGRVLTPLPGTAQRHRLGGSFSFRSLPTSGVLASYTLVLSLLGFELCSITLPICLLARLGNYIVNPKTSPNMRMRGRSALQILIGNPLPFAISSLPH